MERRERPDRLEAPPANQPDITDDKRPAERTGFILSWLESRQEQTRPKPENTLFKKVFRRLVKLERQINPGLEIPEVPPPLYVPHENSETVATDSRPKRTEVAPPHNPDELAEQVARRVQAYEARHEEPTVVLQEMLKAAEVDAPVERYYERRQEVRDEPSMANQTTGAVSVGSILSQAAANFPVSARGRQTQLSFPGTPTAQTDVYRRAMRSGFYGGIVMLLTGLLVYLVISMLK